MATTSEVPPSLAWVQTSLDAPFRPGSLLVAPFELSHNIADRKRRQRLQSNVVGSERARSSFYCPPGKPEPPAKNWAKKQEALLFFLPRLLPNKPRPETFQKSTVKLFCRTIFKRHRRGNNRVLSAAYQKRVLKDKDRINTPQALKSTTSKASQSFSCRCWNKFSKFHLHCPGNLSILTSFPISSEDFWPMNTNKRSLWYWFTDRTSTCQELHELRSFHSGLQSACNSTDLTVRHLEAPSPGKSHQLVQTFLNPFLLVFLVLMIAPSFSLFLALTLVFVSNLCFALSNFCHSLSAFFLNLFQPF